MAWLLGWLAPVTACALLTLSLVNSGTGISRGPSRHDPMFAMVLSNQSCAAYVSEDFQAGQNKWSSVTVDWTIRSSATSGASSFLRRRTN